ncbi:MAG: aminomethyl-transferring glycine dehydrogenase subunit GcvPB [bacterium]
MSEPLIFEISVPGKKGYSLPPLDVPEKEVSSLLPGTMLAGSPPPLPEVSEPELVRHFTRLSCLNYGVDSGSYPLGSCTMKYNPKINEKVARLPGFADIHPLQPEGTVQGALRLMAELSTYLCEITGMEQVSLQPAAGAHGELTALLMIKKYFDHRGEKRKVILVPDSAHGTNPASAALCGFEVIQVPSDEKGNVDLARLKDILDGQTAALMLTNPNTLGLFDSHILAIAQMVHQAGALLYYDGANANATLGITRPGDLGFDLIHLNLHKTFATPHGGGGPGAGPVGARGELVDFLPVPLAIKDPISDRYVLDENRPLSIGRVRSFHGNFLVLVRAYAYIRHLGPAGLREVSENAVLNANYLMEHMKKWYHLPFERTCQHEFVLSAEKQKENGVRALDIAKRLLDYGIHAPTIYFPLIVHEAMMIEPTETESKRELDRFIEVMKAIALECENQPELVTNAPLTTPVKRPDEAAAARKPDLWCKPT